MTTDQFEASNCLLPPIFPCITKKKGHCRNKAQTCFFISYSSFSSAFIFSTLADWSLTSFSYICFSLANLEKILFFNQKLLFDKECTVQPVISSTVFSGHPVLSCRFPESRNFSLYQRDTFIKQLFIKFHRTDCIVLHLHQKVSRSTTTQTEPRKIL